MLTTWTSFVAKTCVVIQSLALITTTTSFPMDTISPMLPALTSSVKFSTQCTESQTWLAKGFHPHDCTSVIDRIYENEVLRGQDEQFEFTSPGSKTRKTRLAKIGTPRKYVTGSCVVTVAMMDQFRPRELPGSDFSKRYEETDIATFQSVWEAALKVYFDCGRFRKGGWFATGKSLDVLVTGWSFGKGKVAVRVAIVPLLKKAGD